MNILEDEALRSGMKGESGTKLPTARACASGVPHPLVAEYSAWPTFPQLYIGGAFYGGADITSEAFRNGTLQEELEKAAAS